MTQDKKQKPEPSSDVGDGSSTDSKHPPKTPTVKALADQKLDKNSDNKKPDLTTSDKSDGKPGLDKQKGGPTSAGEFGPSEEESELKTLFALFSRDVSMAISPNTNRLPINIESVKGPQNKSTNRTPANNFSNLPFLGVQPSWYSECKPSCYGTRFSQTLDPFSCCSNR